MGSARRIVALAGAAWALSGCADQARISLFDDEVIEDAGFWLPNDELSDLEDASIPVDSGPAVAKTSAPLVLRYDFDGQGMRVIDRVGDADALIRGGAELDQQGGLELDGVNDYVDMPNGVISQRHSVTIIAWLRWAGGPCWQRIFDFGSNDAGEGRVGHVTTSLFLTPASCPSQVMMSMSERASDQEGVASDRGLPTDRTVQVAIVIDGDTAESSIYVDGALEAAGTNEHLMSDLNDVNNWLGRSQWVQDGFLRGRFEELRLYDGALSGEEVAELAYRGADRP